MRSYPYFLFLFFPFFLNAQSQKWVNYVNDHLTYDIAIEDNFLWVGTQGGLVRIDLETEERQLYLPANSGMRGFGIQSIYVAPDGVKWLGGDNGGLMRFDGENWEQFYHINTGDTLIRVSEIKAAPNGDLWISSTINNNCGGCSKFFRFDGNEFTYMDEVFGPANNNITNVQHFDIAPNGHIWLIADQKVQQYDGNNVVASFTKTDVGLAADENFRSIWAMDDNKLICVISKYGAGLNQVILKRYDGNQWSEMDYDGSPYQVGSSWVPFKDEKGNLWITYGPNAVDRTYAKFDGAGWESWDFDDLPFRRKE